MKNDSNPIIRSEEVTIDMHICAALSGASSSVMTVSSISGAMAAK